MSLDRRSLFKSIAAVGAATVARPAQAAAREPVDKDNVSGMLYDSTLCIGCKACMVACREANQLEPASDEGLYYDPESLSAHAKTVVKLHRQGDSEFFVKTQCMHCLDPACASACMLGALQKRDFGAVTWEADKCVGCRYCQLACPFNIPKFEWEKTAPKIVKCELCKDRLNAGKQPACVEVCPRNAVIFGKRSELLREAKRRIGEQPERYEPKVYGETDAGGTQVLYLSAAGVPFSALGLPALGTASVPSLPEMVQHILYKGMIAPAALYGILGLVVWRNQRDGVDENDEEVES